LLFRYGQGADATNVLRRSAAGWDGCCVESGKAADVASNPRKLPIGYQRCRRNLSEILDLITIVPQNHRVPWIYYRNVERAHSNKSFAETIFLTMLSILSGSFGSGVFPNLYHSLYLADFLDHRPIYPRPLLTFLFLSAPCEELPHHLIGVLDKQRISLSQF
jgi:hypothetical protein